MRPKSILIDPVDVDADGLAEAQAVAGAGALTLDGALIVGGAFTGDYSRKLGVLSAGDDSGITFTIVGTDPNGKALTEALAGSSAAPGTTESTGYFETVSSVTASGAAAGNVSVGTVDEFVTNTIPIETANADPATVSLEGFSGTMTGKVEETYSRIQYDPIIHTGSPLTSTSSDAVADMSNHASGVRYVAESHSSGAQVRMVINQSRRS